jgi:hypothetical protein
MLYIVCVAANLGQLNAGAAVSQMGRKPELPAATEMVPRVGCQDKPSGT